MTLLALRRAQTSTGSGLPAPAPIRGVISIASPLDMDHHYLYEEARGVHAKVFWYFILFCLFILF